MAYNYQDKAKAKTAFMDGYSYKNVAAIIGCSEGTIKKWADKGGWRVERDGQEHPNMGQVEGHKFTRTTPTPLEAAAEPPPGVRDFDDVPYHPVAVDTVDPAPEVGPDQTSAAVDELRAEVAALNAKNAELTREVAKDSKVVDISLFLSDPVAWTELTNPEGDKYWTNRAETKFANDNMNRAKQGLPQFNINEHPEILDELVEELKEEMRQARSRPLSTVDEYRKVPRRIKMVIDRGGNPTIEQLPLEPQVNNMAGSMADGILRYTVKGFKMTSPILCTREGCYEPAALTPQGGLQFENAYCTAYHESEVEGTSAAFVQEHTATSMMERMSHV